MLARLQQILTLGALLLAAMWTAGCWRTGHPLWAAAGAAMVLGAHVVVLMLEFALLAAVHRRLYAAGVDATPPADTVQLIRAWWGEVLAAPRVFCWRQPFRSRRWPDHLPAGGKGRRGVLLVHGFVCNRGLWNSWTGRLAAQGVPVVAVNLEPVFGRIDDVAATIEAGMRALEGCTGRAPIVVAHSMGGLAVRKWAVEPGQTQRIARLITIGTPHHGTWLARFAMTPNARQMRVGSPWLLALPSEEAPELAARCTCFYGHADNIVFPPETATLPGADRRHLSAVAHVDMVDRPEPWAELQRWLQIAD
jgi:hypothetical protein